MRLGNEEENDNKDKDHGRAISYSYCEVSSLVLQECLSGLVTQWLRFGAVDPISGHTCHQEYSSCSIRPYKIDSLIYRLVRATP
ncbi:hypothetical protein RRG08_041319 [Elysia crispata]|uniref:Uncharacterized protein n=1 Tax=Elysia crispata TaxID=231223 RepID=A0AAE0ZUA8_9GAST|nr:hypothetical protein RRG08_041319 [Elysia crispata]